MRDPYLYGDGGGEIGLWLCGRMLRLITEHEIKALSFGWALCRLLLRSSPKVTLIPAPIRL